MATKQCRKCHAEMEGNEMVCPFCGEYQGVNIVKRVLFVVVVALFLFVLYMWLTTA